MQTSGKLVIVGIVGVALAAAVASWWFRYSATRRVAEFYGAAAVRLIRDAPDVELLRFEPSTKDGLQMEELERFLDAPTNRRDISSMRGLTHLRAALLEDRSYVWPSRRAAHSDTWQWVLIFRDSRFSGVAILMFSPDWQFVTEAGLHSSTERSLVVTKKYVSSAMVLSCKPIAKGLAEMLADAGQQSLEPR